MLFSSTNFGEQYFLFDDYYIPLYRYVKEKFSTNAFLIDLSVCSYGTYIGNVFFYVPHIVRMGHMRNIYSLMSHHIVCTGHMRNIYSLMSHYIVCMGYM